MKLPFPKCQSPWSITCSAPGPPIQALRPFLFTDQSVSTQTRKPHWRFTDALWLLYSFQSCPHLRWRTLVRTCQELRTRCWAFYAGLTHTHTGKLSHHDRVPSGRKKELCAEYVQVKRQLMDKMNCGLRLRGWGDKSEKETVPGPAVGDEAS